MEDKMKLMDLLNRLKWDDTYDFSRVKIYYEDRASEGIAFLTGKDVKRIGEKFLETEKGYIPIHRIKRIEYNGKILWTTHSS